MKNSIKPISLLRVMPFLAVVTAAPAAVSPEKAQAPGFGVYDPNRECPEESRLTFEQLFLSWASYTPAELLRQLQAIQSKGRRPYVTVEPWPDPTITSLPSALLDDVAAGKYDRKIQELTLQLAAFGAPVLLSWGHEMENVTGRYPWATHNAALYQKAYRHFVTKSRLSAKNISYVWSPVGHNNSERYWPGERYVDYVSVSVFEFPAFNQAYYHQVTRSFHDHMTEKYPRVAKYRKPIIIAECGVAGSKEYQLSWLSGALKDLGNYPLVKTLIYFNAKDTPGAWGKDYETPDWRISGCGLVQVIEASL